MVNNFHWIFPDKLAGFERPTVKDLHMLRKQGFTSIVCLQECKSKIGKWESLTDYDFPPYRRDDIERAGLELFHISVEDGASPTPEQMDKFISYVDNPKRIVGVHCWAGIGRTGAMLGAYLGVKNNLTGWDTIEALRKIWVGYIQTEEQEDGLVEFIDSRISI